MPASRPIWLALAVSALLHLSAVTLFRIVVMAPSGGSQYGVLEILPAEDGSRLAKLALFSGNDQPLPPWEADRSPFMMPDFHADAEDAGPKLPTIQLPRFAAEPMAPPRLATEDIRRIDRPAGEPRVERSPDSWARLGQGVEALRLALSRATGLEDPRMQEEGRIAIVQTPAGVSVDLTWLSDPRDRAVTYYPRLSGLYAVKDADLSQPVTLLIAVDASGKVVEVKAPPEDEAGIVKLLTDALWKFEFVSASEDMQRAEVTASLGARRP